MFAIEVLKKVLPFKLRSVFAVRSKIFIVVFVIVTIQLGSMATGVSAGYTLNQGTQVYVYPCSGMFCKRDGTRLVLNGVTMNLYKPNAFTQHDFWAVSNAGINEVKLQIFWDKLEPQYQVYDNDYIAEINQVRAWAQQYGLYLVLNLQTIASVGTPPHTPPWMSHWYQVYNSTGTQELINSWKVLAGLVNNDLNFVSYIVPWNEANPPDFNADNATYVMAMKFGVNMTHIWEQWLQAKYGSIQALNSTWNAHIYDQLNGTGNPPYRPMDFTSGRGYSGEDNWSGIKPLGPYSYNFKWKTGKQSISAGLSARWTDWQLFRLDILSNLTRSVAQAIRTVDPNHIIASNGPNGAGNGNGLTGWAMLPRFLSQVPEVQAIAVHRYLNVRSITGQFGMSAYYGEFISIYGNIAVAHQLFPNTVFWHDEWGSQDSRGGSDLVSHGPNQVSMVMAQDEISGVLEGGFSQTYYENSVWSTGPWSDVVNTNAGELEGDYYAWRYFMRMYDYSTSRSPDILLILPQVANQAFYFDSQVFPFLGLHIFAGIVDESFVTPSLLGNYRAAVYWVPPSLTGVTVGGNKTTVQTVTQWAKAGNFVLWLGFGSNLDKYFRSGGYSPLVPLENYMFAKGSEDQITRPTLSGTTTIAFSQQFGDIPGGTTIQIPVWPQGMAFGYGPTNVAQTNGLQLIATDTKYNTYSLWSNGTSIFFYGALSPPILVNWNVPFPRNYTDPFLRLARAFLKFSGVWYDEKTDYNIQYRYDPGGGFITAYERLGQGGTYTLRLDLQRLGLDPNANYLVWKVMNWTTYYNRTANVFVNSVTGSALSNLPLTFQANQTIILRILPYNVQSIVYSDARLNSTRYDAVTTLLNVSFGNNANRKWKIAVAPTGPAYILNALTYNASANSPNVTNRVVTFLASGNNSMPLVISYQRLGGFRVAGSTYPLTAVTLNNNRNGYITVVAQGISVQVYSNPANVTVLQSTGPVQVNIVTTAVTGTGGTTYKYSTITITSLQGTLVVVTPQIPA